MAARIFVLLMFICGVLVGQLVFAQVDLAKAAGLTEEEKAKFKGDANRCENFDTFANCEKKRKLANKKTNDVARGNSAGPLASNTSSAAAGSYGFSPQVIEKIIVRADTENLPAPKKDKWDGFGQSFNKTFEDREFGIVSGESIQGQRYECRKDVLVRFLPSCAVSGIAVFDTNTRR